MSPLKVSATMIAVVRAVADAPPPAFSGAGNWEATLSWSRASSADRVDERLMRDAQGSRWISGQLATQADAWFVPRFRARRVRIQATISVNCFSCRRREGWPSAIAKQALEEAPRGGLWAYRLTLSILTLRYTQDEKHRDKKKGR
jgi:hypothetical protein